ncbi:hypothetical protein H8S90_22245 [Olivibacter sp. SDN3]|uniref:hypothetical protein n=1 Tax=Olivibacter sp. SDN3 TaxID=2764720 RepID=UPI00165126BB|nr:hypothetical protein [Olivibacter sp. SDN3]QNL49417.1 hypothetical protein H8S90_22245 [Olivibacter sp. SDN3]
MKEYAQTLLMMVMLPIFFCACRDSTMQDPIPICREVSENVPWTIKTEDDTDNLINIYYNDGRPQIYLNGNFRHFQQGNKLISFVDQADSVSIIENPYDSYTGVYYDVSEEDIEKLVSLDIDSLAGLKIYEGMRFSLKNTFICFRERNKVR